MLVDAACNMLVDATCNMHADSVLEHYFKACFKIHTGWKFDIWCFSQRNIKVSDSTLFANATFPKNCLKQFTLTITHEKIDWLLNTCPRSICGQAVVCNNSLKRRRNHILPFMVVSLLLCLCSVSRKSMRKPAPKGTHLPLDPAPKGTHLPLDHGRYRHRRDALTTRPRAVPAPKGTHLPLDHGLIANRLRQQLTAACCAGGLRKKTLNENKILTYYCSPTVRTII